MKLLSWNILYDAGATVDEVMHLLEAEKPDFLLLQEVTREIESLLNNTTGYFSFQPWPGKRFGMGVWSTNPFEPIKPIKLPYSKIPGSFPRRAAQIIQSEDVTIANVHLSHGQILNRRQLSRIALNTSGSTVIMGDFNAVGPLKLQGFADVGPKQSTHRAKNLIPFRLDRCLVRNLQGADAKILGKYGSDHHPISVTITP